MITYTSISTGIASIIFFIMGLRVFYSWAREKSYSMKHFTIFLLGIALQQMFFSFGTGLLAVGTRTSGYLWAAAHIFMFISLNSLIRISLYLVFSDLEKRLEDVLLGLSALYSVIGTIIIFLSVPQFQSSITENRIFISGTPILTTFVIVVFTTISLLFSGGSFLYLAFKTKDSAVRLRSILITVGLFVYLTAGPAHNLITSPLLSFLVDSLLIVSALFVMAGIYLPRVLEERREQS
jgi:hypothetical protein